MSQQSHQSSDGSDALPWAEEFAADRIPVTRLREPLVGSRDGEIRGRFPVGWIARDQEVIDESWRRQFVCVTVDGCDVRIQARLPKDDAYAGVRGDQGEAPWPLAGDLLIAGALRGPAPHFLGDEINARDQLVDQATTFHIAVRGAILVDRDHQWSEPAVIATGAATSEKTDGAWQSRFLELCHGFGIDTVVRVRDGAWQVLTLRAGKGAEVRVLTSDPCSVTRDVDRRCVLLPAPEAGQYCHMRGGPWTSSSIHSAGGWRDHRDQIGAAIGCDTCEGKRYLLQGQVKKGGGPVSVVPVPRLNRWLAPLDEDVVGEGARHE